MMYSGDEDFGDEITSGLWECYEGEEDDYLEDRDEDGDDDPDYEFDEGVSDEDLW